jgi:hypothetical protein
MAMVKHVGDHGENSAAAAAPKAVATVGAQLFPRLEREDYALWAINMEVAMEAAEI